MVGFFRTLQEKSPGPESVRLHAGAIRIGVGLIILGIAAMLLAAAANWLTLRRLRRGELPVLTQWSEIACIHQLKPVANGESAKGRLTMVADRTGRQRSSRIKSRANFSKIEVVIH